MKITGLLLVVLGVLALAYGGISYNRQRTVLDVGPIHATATERRTIPFSPLVGGIAIISGVALLFVSRRRPA